MQQRQGWAFQEDVGGGAFYGPKIDIKISDALGRKWQCSTVQARGGLTAGRGIAHCYALECDQLPSIMRTDVVASLAKCTCLSRPPSIPPQLDFNLPERFDMFYIRWLRHLVHLRMHLAYLKL